MRVGERGFYWRNSSANARFDPVHPFEYRFLDADFAYRVSIVPSVFLLAAGLAVAVAYLTVALQSAQTARATPIRTLRHE